LWDVLKKPGIPVSLRICAGTDGSVTMLLEQLTGETVHIKTKEQRVVKATPEVAGLLDIEEGDEVNERLVVLTAGETVYALASALAPVKRMPPDVRKDIIQADIPIGRILRDHKLETRRDIINMGITANAFFGGIPVLSREYNIIHKKSILMWINEFFPVDGRWDVGRT